VRQVYNKGIPDITQSVAVEITSDCWLNETSGVAHTSIWEFVTHDPHNIKLHVKIVAIWRN